ncbi:hypothetical protein [Rhodococcus kronopolitis]|uniref:Uncharacterized protein n=1 Tax=Rhodococcus kronopolitis TaxID=1460226 RepID=A0ABV9FMV9_9NOCA
MSDKAEQSPPGTAHAGKGPVDRARLERIFGDVLPDLTRDERADGPDPRDGSADEWLRSQVPPHHG